VLQPSRTEPYVSYDSIDRKMRCRSRQTVAREAPNSWAILMSVPQLFQPSPATGHDAEILAVSDQDLGYDAETLPYQQS
jgi:hypothetical protein